MYSEYVNSTTAEYGYGALWKKNSPKRAQPMARSVEESTR